MKNYCIILILLTFVCFFVHGCKERSHVVYERVSNTSGDHLKKTTYLGNGAKTEQLLTVDSIPDGYYREIQNGKIKTTGWYKEGKMDSAWTYFFVNSGQIYKSE